MVFRFWLAAALLIATTGASTAQTLSTPDEWPEDSNRTRLLLGTNGRSLRQGEMYLDMIGISVPTVEVGVTDRLSLGAGTVVLIPGIRPFDVYWLTPKFQIFAGKRTSTAVGVIHGRSPDGDAGLAYAVTTYGSKRGAVTAGINYAYAIDGGVAGAPVVLLGGEWRASRGVTFLTENYVTNGALLSGGIRFIHGRWTMDAGMLVDPVTRIRAPLIRWTVAAGSGH